jgi:hypothetical protein
MERYIQGFPEMLTGVDFQTLEEDPQSIFALSDELKLIYLNPGWFRFAKENQGEPGISERFPIGTDIARAMSEPFKQFYIDLYNELLQKDTVWDHDYECSSPDAYRVFHERAYPLHNVHGLLVVNSLLVEKEHIEVERVTMPPIEEHYRHANGLITQCSYCRRFQRAAAPAVWDWIPDWISHMPKRVSHSLCKICFDYYFKHHETTPSQPDT